MIDGTRRFPISKSTFFKDYPLIQSILNTGTYLDRRETSKRRNERQPLEFPRKRNTSSQIEKVETASARKVYVRSIFADLNDCETIVVFL